MVARVRRVIRRPIAWLIAAEIVVVAALGAVTWSVITERMAGGSSAASGPVLTQPLDTASPQPSAGASPSPNLTAGLHSSPPARALGPTPGMSTDADFWRAHLSRVNRDDAGWEQAQWRIARAVVEFARGYLEQVVIPAIERAEGGAHGP
jgi:hypothetical protein